MESVRAQGRLGSSLQAWVELGVPRDDLELLASLGDEARFAFIVSRLRMHEADGVEVLAEPASASKCERCWHWVDDVGSDPGHAGLCKRCVSNLHGAGEVRKHV